MRKVNKKLKIITMLGLIGAMLLENTPRIIVHALENGGYIVAIEEYEATNQCLNANVITDRSRLGTLTHYNGIIFSTFYAAQADVEGALAVGGTSQIGTLGMGFDFGGSVIGHYTNPNDYPTFLSRNQPTFYGGQWGETHFNVYYGPMVVGREIANEFCQTAVLNGNHLVQGDAHVWLRGGFSFATPEAINGFFTQAQTQSVATANLLASTTHAEEMNITVAQLNNGSADFSNLERFIPNNLEIVGASMIVINIEDAGHVVINEPKLNGAFREFDLVVLNFPNATSVEIRPAALFINGAMMGSLNAQMGIYAERLLWNFPVASTVNVTSHDVIGSVFAPNAHYNAYGGSTNGMLIANQFTTRGGHELHAFRPRLRDEIFNVRPVQPEEDDETFYDIDPEGMMPEFDIIEEEDDDTFYGVEPEGMMPELDIIEEEGDDTFYGVEPEGVMPELDIIEEEGDDTFYGVEPEGMMPELDIIEEDDTSQKTTNRPDGGNTLPQTGHVGDSFLLLGASILSLGTIVIFIKKRLTA